MLLQELQIQSVTHEDIPALVEFRRALYRERRFISPQEAEDLRDYAEGLDDALSDEGSVEWVAYADDKVLASLSAEVVGQGPRSVELHGLFVAAAHRGLGIGSLLLTKLDTDMPAGLPFGLTVLIGNEGARRLYERHGFQQHPIDSFRMVKERGES